MNPEETVVRTTYPYSFATTNDAILDPSYLELNRGLDRMLATCFERFDWLKMCLNQTNQSNQSSYDVVTRPRYLKEQLTGKFIHFPAVRGNIEL